MIFPGKEPTAPLYITYKHVSVLKHFFGEDYIISELEAAGIKPTEDKSSRSSLLSQDQLFGRGGSQDLTTYKTPSALIKSSAPFSMTEKRTKTSIRRSKNQGGPHPY